MPGTAKRHEVRGPWLLLLLVMAAGLGPGVVQCGGREVEFRCEEAAAKLRDCCPGVDVQQLSCNFQEASGCTPAQNPLLSIDESHCIVDRDCAQLQAGVCARVRARRSNPDAGATTPVCP